MGKFGPLASLLGQIRQIFLLCVISSPLFSPDSHRRGSVQSKLCYGPGGCPRHVAISTAALGFIIHNTGRRYRISLIYMKMHTNRGRFQVSTLSTNYQIKSIRTQLRGGKNTFQWYLHHIQFKKSPLSSFQFKQTLDGTSTSDVFCTIWGHPGSQRLCNSTPTAARTTCFCKSKPDCSFCVSIWHPALKAGDTFNDNFRFLNRQKSSSRVPDIYNYKTTASDELHCTTWPLLMTKLLKNIFNRMQEDTDY